MSLYSFCIEPFDDYGFMRRALVASWALAIAAGPVGVFLVLRRMSLVSEAMSHAILPGAALGFLFAGGLSLEAMGLGALLSGLMVALLSGLASRSTVLKEDASFAGFYISAMAFGVLIVSLRGSNIDLMHVLFGTILAVDTYSLIIVVSISTLTVALLAIVYRPLVFECFDPKFFRDVGGHGARYHLIFLFLLVIDLIAGFQTLGTLMAVGMMMIPAVIARLWAKTLSAMFVVAALSGVISGYGGLLFSYHLGFASGPTIILVASALYGLSLLFAPSGVLCRALRSRA